MTQGLPISTQPVQGKDLLVVERNSYPFKVTGSALVKQGRAFTGQVDLSTPFGTFWDDYTQSGALTITNSSDAVVGGCDRLKITSDGSAITLPSDWVNVGSTAISAVLNDVNRLFIVKVSSTEINYSVKVN